MGEIVQLELPEDLARRAREIAARTQRRVEDVLLEWIGQLANEVPVDSLSDEQLLSVCDQRLESGEQDELTGLLIRNREGELTDPERFRLDELMKTYRRGLVRKAQALKIAVDRGLRPPLG